MEKIENYSSLRELAQQVGFTTVGMLDPEKIKLRSEVRDACAENKCGQYGKNWACPPGCGELKECAKIISCYKKGLILQTTGALEDSFDIEAMKETAKKHAQNFRKFARAMRVEGMKVFILGDGSCEICPECTYPKKPCRFPERKTSSMEAFGIIVSDVCADNRIPYYYGKNTITYTGCVLF